MTKRFSNLIIITLFVFLLSAAARGETFYAYLNGAQEVPAVATSATGYARVFVNESTMTLTFTVVFNGLSSAQTLSHIHAPGVIGANGPVAIDFGAVGGTSGTITGTRSITATQLSQIRAHQGYVNVHSTNFGGGEIRGQLGIKRPVDFDGDGRQDYSVWRFPSVSPPGVAPVTWWNLNSTGGVQSGQQWGDANRDYPAPGDYDGDGRDDYAIFRGGTNIGDQSEFWILRSSDSTLFYNAWGTNGDIAVARDYDGDGRTDVAVFRRGTPSVWYIRQTSNGVDRAVAWGTNGATVSDRDYPVPGDYDGDGKFDLAVYRSGALSPANTYIVLRSSDGAAVYQQWGNFNSDYVLPGDYDGDGKYDYAIARTGASATNPLVWWILQSSNGQTRVQVWGNSADIPVQGDYDGDARADIAIYRQGATAGAASNFWVLRSFTNTSLTTQWGIRGDFAVNSFDIR
ncbi:MAG: CHRD domain-containing protein [Pyrinomonadaceae bacterium]